MNFYLTDVECAHCGDGFESGQRAIVAVSAKVVDDPDPESHEVETETTTVDYFHSTCATVLDSRPPEWHLYPVGNTIHAMEVETAREPGNGFRYRSLCGSVRDIPRDAVVSVRAQSLDHAIDAAYEDLVREAGAPDVVDGDGLDTCGNCTRAAPDVVPMAGVNRR